MENVFCCLNSSVKFRLVDTYTVNSIRMTILNGRIYRDVIDYIFAH